MAYFIETNVAEEQISRNQSSFVTLKLDHVVLNSAPNWTRPGVPVWVWFRARRKPVKSVIVTDLAVRVLAYS